MEIKILKKIIKQFSRIRKIKTDDLKNVSGAGEPEEFSWKPKGYETPIKDQSKEGEWEYGAIGTNVNKDAK